MNDIPIIMMIVGFLMAIVMWLLLVIPIILDLIDEIKQRKIKKK